MDGDKLVLLRCPQEIWIYDNEFHPLGGVANEVIGGAADWFVTMLRRDYEPNMDNRFWIGRDGKVIKGDCCPPWWNGAFAV